MIEALTIVAVISILVVLLLVVGPRSSPRAPALKMKNSTQLRAIMTEYALWSDANGRLGPATNPTVRQADGQYPGSFGTGAGGFPPNAADTSVVGRLWVLVNATGIDPLNPKVLINPLPGVPEKAWSNPSITLVPGVTTAGAAGFGPNNVSYALLSTKMGSEWWNNTNAGCPMICDRNRGTPSAPSSSWSGTDHPAWQGSVAWGDVHATFETSSVNLNETLYGNHCPVNDLWAPATSSNAGMVNPGS
jgi:hypothetical protein